MDKLQGSYFVPDLSSVKSRDAQDVLRLGVRLSIKALPYESNDAIEPASSHALHCNFFGD